MFKETNGVTFISLELRRPKLWRLSTQFDDAVVSTTPARFVPMETAELRIEVDHVECDWELNLGAKGC